MLVFFVHRCQRREQELIKTKEELRIVSEQLQCAAVQKYHLQEKLCRYEVLHLVLYDISILVECRALWVSGSEPADLE